MAPKHLHDQFSAAYDGVLGVAQAERFRAHLDACPECAQAYDAFRTSIDAIRALPPARMPLPVHLPSDAPVAELTLRSRLGRLPRLRLVPGAFTAVGAVAAAAVLLLALNHQGGVSPTTIPGSSRSALNGAAAAPSCPQALPAPAAAQSPTSYQHRVSETDPGRPGQELVLATQSSSASPGAKVLVYAQLTVPSASAGPPGAAAPGQAKSTTSSAAVAPCLHLAGDPNASFATAGNPTTPQPLAGAFGPTQGTTTQGGATTPVSPGAIQSFTVPAGTPPGMVLHITASIPANYPVAGDPPLTVDLTITVR